MQNKSKLKIPSFQLILIELETEYKQKYTDGYVNKLVFAPLSNNAGIKVRDFFHAIGIKLH